MSRTDETSSRSVLRVGGLLRRCEQQLVDAVAVHVDDFDAPAVELKTFALVRNARELLEREAGGGVEIAARLLGQSERLAHLVDGGAAVDQPGAVVALDQF